MRGLRGSSSLRESAGYDEEFMGHSKKEKAESHQRILSVAAQEFRKKGFDSVSIDDVMKKAGLTHGGFYKHFATREELIAEATLQAFRAGREALARAMARTHG